MLTVKQVSERLNVSVGLVYKIIQQGKLNAHRINSAYRISEEQLSAYLAAAAEPVDEPLMPFTTKYL